jgi:hypothetical protein
MDISGLVAVVDFGFLNKTVLHLQALFFFLKPSGFVYRLLHMWSLPLKTF